MNDASPRRRCRRARRFLAAAVALVLPFAAGACATSGAGAEADVPAGPVSGAPPAGQSIDRELALATFDSAWSRISHTYYDPDFRGLDWAAVRDELRPRAAASETLEALRSVLRDMLSRLGESHFAIFPQETVDGLSTGDGPEGPADADVGLRVRWVEGELTVVRTESGPALDAGVHPGWVVEAIGPREIARWQEDLAGAETAAARRALEVSTVSAAHGLLQGPDGSVVTVRVRDGDGRVRALDLVRRPMPGERVQFGNLPAFFVQLEHERVRGGDGGCVGVIRFNVWMLPLVDDFNRAVDELADCRGIVIDLRGNVGGVGGMVMSTAGSFFDEQEPLGVVLSRSGEMRFVAMPRGVTAAGEPRETFDGRLAVLIDEQSMSTSEIFAAGLSTTGRARLFGTPTPGYALPAMMVRLPTQDVLYHAIANLTDPEGRRLEGAGVEPDVLLPLTRADLLAGRDRALEAAVDWAGAVSH